MVTRSSGVHCFSALRTSIIVIIIIVVAVKDAALFERVRTIGRPCSTSRKFEERS